MAVSVKTVCYMEVAIDGIVKRVGSVSPVSISAATGIAYDKDFSLGNNTTATIFDASAATCLADFDYLIVISSVDMYMELTTDQNNGVGDEILTVPLTANLPFLLGRDDSYANYTSNFGGGTLDVIDRIRARNISGGTGTLRIVALT